MVNFGHVLTQCIHATRVNIRLLCTSWRNLSQTTIRKQFQIRYSSTEIARSTLTQTNGAKFLQASNFVYRFSRMNTGAVESEIDLCRKHDWWTEVSVVDGAHSWLMRRFDSYWWGTEHQVYLLKAMSWKSGICTFVSGGLCSYSKTL
jgi:hypothetical protein